MTLEEYHIKMQSLTQPGFYYVEQNRVWVVLHLMFEFSPWAGLPSKNASYIKHWSRLDEYVLSDAEFLNTYTAIGNKIPSQATLDLYAKNQILIDALIEK